MSWTFLTNHAYVLFCVADDPKVRMRDIADRVGITERAAQRIVAELTDAGYLTHTRKGRRNVYKVRPNHPLRHPIGREVEVGGLLEILDSKNDR